MKHIIKYENFKNEFVKAYHVTKKKFIENIKINGLNISSMKGNDFIKGYKNRLFLTFDKESTNDIIKGLRDVSNILSDDLNDEFYIVEIDWKKFIKDNKNVQLFKDKDFEYYEDKKGRFGGFYIKENIPKKYLTQIKKSKK